MDRIESVFGKHVHELFRLMLAGELPCLQLNYVQDTDEVSDLDLVPVITFSFQRGINVE